MKHWCRNCYHCKTGSLRYAGLDGHFKIVFVQCKRGLWGKNKLDIEAAKLSQNAEIHGCKSYEGGNYGRTKAKPIN